MKPIMMDMKDMSESTELYESRPHPFFIIFIYLIMLIIGTAIIWMCFFKIDNVVKASGIIRTEESVQAVTNIVGGKLSKVSIIDGQEVNKGDVLYLIDTDDTQRQLMENETVLLENDSRLEMLEEYLKVLKGEKTSLIKMKENPYYSEYQNRFKLVQISFNSVNLDVATQKKQYQSALESYNNSLDYYNTQLNQLTTMKQSIKDKKNYFTNIDNYYYLNIENYLGSYRDLEAQYNTQIKTLTESGATQIVINEKEEEKESALVKMEMESLSSVEQQINTVNTSVININNNINETEARIESIGTGSYENNISNIQATEINSVNTELATYHNQKKEIQSNIDSLEQNLENAKVIAEKDGVVNFNIELVEGNYLEAGAQVLTVIPTTKDNYIVEAYIENNDIGKLKKGQEIKYEIGAFPSSEYGNITGKILNISEDIKISKDESSAYYIAEGSIKKVNLMNSDGDEVKLKTGMECEVKVVIGQKRVIQYLLEKISLLD